MLINVIKRDKTTELRSIRIGACLAGLRITSIVIENAEEAIILTEDKNKLWLIKASKALWTFQQSRAASQ